MKKSFRIAIIISALLISSVCVSGCDKKSSDSNSVIYYTSKSENMLGDDESKAEPEKKPENADNQNSKAENDGNKNSKAETVKENVKVELSEGVLGDTIDKNGISVTLEKAEISLTGTAENTNLMYAVFEIKNLSENDIPVNYLNNFDISIDGADPEISTLTSITASSCAKRMITDIEKFSSTVNSGNSLKGFISFEVPTDASQLDIIYYPYRHSDTQENSFGYDFKVNIADMPVVE